MSKFFKNIINNKEGNIFLNAAQTNGWKIVVPYGPEADIARISKQGVEISILRGILSANTDVAAGIANNKYITQVVLSSVTPFVTSAKLFKISDVTPDVIQQQLQKHTTVVVKPVDLNNGEGVTPLLSTIDAVKAAIKKVQNFGAEQVIIEKHIQTINEYRVILWKGKPIDILRRIPAYVVGNGRSTIEELVTQKNEYRLQTFDGLFLPINIDDDFHTFLERENLSSESILEDQRYLKVESTCNLDQGGETERIDLATVHPAYMQLFEQIYTSTNLVYCGVDLITPNLNTEPQVGKTAVNELNRAPAFTVGFYSDIATNQPFYGATKLLEAIEKR